MLVQRHGDCGFAETGPAPSNPGDVADPVALLWAMHTERAIRQADRPAQDPADSRQNCPSRLRLSPWRPRGSILPLATPDTPRDNARDPIASAGLAGDRDISFESGINAWSLSINLWLMSLYQVRAIGAECINERHSGRQLEILSLASQLPALAGRANEGVRAIAFRRRPKTMRIMQ